MANEHKEIRSAEIALRRTAMALSFSSLVILVLTRLVAWPAGMLFAVLILLTGRIKSRDGKRLTAIFNIIALVFVVYILIQSTGMNIITVCVEVLPYFFLTVQIYYLLFPSFEEKYYFFSVNVLMTIVESALVENKSFFVLFFTLFFVMLLRGAVRAEYVRVVKALIRGRDTRARSLFSRRDTSAFQIGSSAATSQIPGGIIVQGVEQQGVRKQAGFAVAMIFVILLFVLLPRTGPVTGLGAFAAGVDNTGNRDRVGFSGEITHGAFGRIAQDNTMVMTVKADRERVSENRLKWRGKALNSFDGKHWKSSSRSLAGGQWTRESVSENKDQGRENVFIPDIQSGVYILNPKSGGNPSGRNTLPRIRFRFLLKGVRTVFTPPRPVFISRSFGRTILEMDHNGSLRLRRLRREQGELVYTVWVRPHDPQTLRRMKASPYISEPIGMVRSCLQLPSDLDPRIRELSRTLTTGKTPYNAVLAVQSYLEQNCTYSLNSQHSTSGTDPLADFLFTRKTGHCEYFASSMAVLLRCAKIPSRVVVGFQKGEWNAPGEFFAVRQRDAHAWVEAFFQGVGWMTFDPSPRSAENRAFLSGRSWIQKNIMPYVALLDEKYYDYVIEYNRGTRAGLFSRVGKMLRWIKRPVEQLAGFIPRLRWRNLMMMASAAGIVFLVLMLILRSRKRGVASNPSAPSFRYRPRKMVWGSYGKRVADAYLKVRRLLEKEDLGLFAFMTPCDFLRYAEKQGVGMPEQGAAIGILRELTEMYENARFGYGEFTRKDVLRAEEFSSRLTTLISYKAASGSSAR
mgnify:CR=1 FL=1